MKNLMFVFFHSTIFCSLILLFSQLAFSQPSSEKKWAYIIIDESPDKIFNQGFPINGQSNDFIRYILSVNHDELDNQNFSFISVISDRNFIQNFGLIYMHNERERNRLFIYRVALNSNFYNIDRSIRQHLSMTENQRHADALPNYRRNIQLAHDTFDWSNQWITTQPISRSMIHSVRAITPRRQEPNGPVIGVTFGQNILNHGFKPTHHSPPQQQGYPIPIPTEDYPICPLNSNTACANDTLAVEGANNRLFSPSLFLPSCSHDSPMRKRSIQQHKCHVELINVSALYRKALLMQLSDDDDWHSTPHGHSVSHGTATHDEFY